MAEHGDRGSGNKGKRGVASGDDPGDRVPKKVKVEGEEGEEGDVQVLTEEGQRNMDLLEAAEMARERMGDVYGHVHVLPQEDRQRFDQQAGKVIDLLAEMEETLKEMLKKTL